MGIPAPRAIVMERYHAAYVEIAKVASSSIKVYLAGLLDISLDAVGGNPHRVVWPELPLDQLPADYFVFAVVRNPWERLLSCYRDKVAGEPAEFTRIDDRSGVAMCLSRFDVFTPDMSFDAFIDAVEAIPDGEADEHFRSQCTFLEGGRRAVDFIARQERLDTDFAKILDRLGLPTARLGHRQGTPGTVEYRTYYTAPTRAAVARRYHDDIERFGYEF